MQVRSLLTNDEFAHLSEVAQRQQRAATSQDPPDDDGCWLPQRFKRVVWVVVDALRFDFAAFTPPEEEGQGGHGHTPGVKYEILSLALSTYCTALLYFILSLALLTTPILIPGLQVYNVVRTTHCTDNRCAVHRARGGGGGSKRGHKCWHNSPLLLSYIFDCLYQPRRRKALPQSLAGDSRGHWGRRHSRRLAWVRGIFWLVVSVRGGPPYGYNAGARLCVCVYVCVGGGLTPYNVVGYSALPPSPRRLILQ